MVLQFVLRRGAPENNLGLRAKFDADKTIGLDRNPSPDFFYNLDDSKVHKVTRLSGLLIFHF